jgi:hypothetical protein
MSPVNNNRTMVLHITGSLGGSINNRFCLLGRFSYLMRLVTVLHWRGRQVIHGGEAGPEQEIGKHSTRKVGCSEGGGGISGKGSIS